MQKVIRRENLITPKGKAAGYVVSVADVGNMIDTVQLNVLLLKPLDGQTLNSRNMARAKLMGLPMQVAAADKLGLSRDGFDEVAILTCQTCHNETEVSQNVCDLFEELPADKEEAFLKCPVNGCNGIRAFGTTEIPTVIWDCDEFKDRYVIVQVTHDEDDFGTKWARAFIQGGVSPEDQKELEILRTGKESNREVPVDVAQVGCVDIPIMNGEPSDRLDDSEEKS